MELAFSSLDHSIKICLGQMSREQTMLLGLLPWSLFAVTSTFTSLVTPLPNVPILPSSPGFLLGRQSHSYLYPFLLVIQIYLLSFFLSPYSKTFLLDPIFQGRCFVPGWPYSLPSVLCHPCFFLSGTPLIPSFLTSGCAPLFVLSSS